MDSLPWEKMLFRRSLRKMSYVRDGIVRGFCMYTDDATNTSMLGRHPFNAQMVIQKKDLEMGRSYLASLAKELVLRF